MERIKNAFLSFTNPMPRGPNNEPKPDFAWFEIFLRCDYEELKNMSEVCRQFYHILDAEFWRSRCLMDGIDLPPQHVIEFAQKNDKYVDYLYLYHYAHKNNVNPYGENLLRDAPVNKTTAANFAGASDWMVYESRGCHYEEPPEGYNATPEMPESCLATSFRWGHRQLMVDLTRCGVEPWILDYLRPKIVVEERHAPRHDCGAIYKLKIAMRKEDEGMPRVEGDLAPSEKRGIVLTKQYEQWANQPWTTETLVFEKYPAGMRKATVVSCAKDTQFWAGNFGMKFTGTKLRLAFPDDLHWYALDEIVDEPADEQPRNVRGPFRSLRIPFQRLRHFHADRAQNE
ncbi:unnamed protein product, partial [Mesorhabditis spiculigera]